MFAYFNGLFLGFSLIIALGPQNVFLIKQGARKNHALLSAIICFLCDLILICASITGLHELLLHHPMLQVWMMFLGCAFLLFYALKALKSAFSSTKHNEEQALLIHNKTQIILLALGFSLLNPHAIIDSLVIIGGGSTEYPDQQFNFLLGVVTASLLWFSALTFIARYFSTFLARTKVWKGVELTSGLLMSSIGIKLGSSCWRLLASI
ncbi:MAG: LysE/ArgO family amino acid transporter [Legionella sp.]|nr:LysE/ArgO family amino acid transporter [Legionella sp.]